MLIAGLKLADIAARSLFVLIALYALAPRSSGQLGLALTLVGLFGFLSGFERYLDLQRTLVGKTPAQSDALILQATRFFAMGYAIWLLPLAMLLTFWVELDALSAALWLVLAICEHITNEAYRIALVTRHRWLLLGSLIKNVALLIVVVVAAVANVGFLDLGSLLVVWTTLSVAAAVATAAIFLRAAAPGARLGLAHGSAFAEQYRRSRTHFVMGLVALASLQCDRLIAGAVLTLEDSGIYFRHVVLAASVYQAFGIASHNRILPGIYSALIAGDGASAKRLVERERWLYVLLSLFLISVLALCATGLAGDIPALRLISPSYLVVLMLAYVVRGLADYNSILLNASYREREIFSSQLIAVSVTLACGIGLAPLWGIAGLVAAMLGGAAAYFVLTQYRVQVASIMRQRPS